jgi:Protein of unknown function (DUF3318)
MDYMNPNDEIYRLIDLMPASGRMFCKIISKPEQSSVVVVEFPPPWQRNRSIAINFDLWNRLSRPQRDMVLLRTVSWLMGVKWFKPELNQGLVAAGVVGTMFELAQVDPIGAVMAAGLTVLAGTQIWRSQRSSQREIDADEAALRIAQRRGYSEADAARHLLSAIEAVANIELRPGVNFTELLRCQNLRAIAGLSTIGIPDSLRRE